MTNKDNGWLDILLDAFSKDGSGVDISEWRALYSKTGTPEEARRVTWNAIMVTLALVSNGLAEHVETNKKSKSLENSMKLNRYALLMVFVVLLGLLLEQYNFNPITVALPTIFTTVIVSPIIYFLRNKNSREN